MNIWKNVVARPMVWIACGVVIGGVAMAGILNWKVGIPTAFAGQETKTSPIANIKTESMAALRDLNDSFANLTEFVAPSVVSIRGERSASNAGGRFMPQAMGEGSGVIYSADGWILTNDHVVADFDKVTVVLNDGREFPGKVTRGNDPQNDIALVKIEAKDLPVARLGDSDRVRSGEFAIAVGAPFGLENTVTVGHISALGRASAVQDRGYSNMIQTDAPINPGNSGGPLMNIEGEVIGINTSILNGGASPFGGSAGNVGIGFAIPSNQARLIADMLRTKGKIVRGYMGLVPENLKKFEKSDKKVESGAIVRSVEANGPAASAGLQAGDIITEVGTWPIRNEQDVRNSMLRVSPGTSAKVKYVRSGQTREATVKVAEFPRALASMRPTPPNDSFKDFGPNDLDLDKLREQFEKGQKEDGDVPPVRQGAARLGVSVATPNADSRKTYNLPESAKGAVITAVEPDSVADRLGLKVGDLIQRLGNKEINTPEDLVAAMGSIKWGDTVNLKFTRFTSGGQSTIDRPVNFR